jgi:serine/threonine protein kinase
METVPMVLAGGGSGGAAAADAKTTTPAPGQKPLDQKQYSTLIQQSGLFSTQELKSLPETAIKGLFTLLKGMIDRIGPEAFLSQARDPASQVCRYIEQKVRPEYGLPPRPGAAAGRQTTVNPAPVRAAATPETRSDPGVSATPTGTVITPIKGPGTVHLTPAESLQAQGKLTPTPASGSGAAGGSGGGGSAGATGATGQYARNLKNLAGRNIDGYVIQKQLGAGGMGAVFLARQVSLERDVAFKVLAPKLAGNPDFLSRFTREALSAAQLSHHNIVQVFDVGSVDDIHYITMEFVRGESLAQMIKRDGRLQVDDAAANVLQAARGLKYAHEQGIAHRDIKPDNLMLNEHGVVKIADMGLAKRIGAAEKLPTGAAGATPLDSVDNLTHADVAMGTPAYIAPEQARDAGSAGAQADQYSLGCTLYYLCAGTTPYSGKTAFELISKHLNEPFVPLDVHISNVPPALSVILTRMLEKDPEKRFPNMGEVVRVLEAYLGVDSAKGPYTPREHHLAVLEQTEKEYYAAPSVKKRRMAAAGFLSLMTLLVVVALLGKWFILAGGLLGLLVLTPLANFIIDGFLSKTYLFRRVRAVFFGMPALSWVKTAGGAIVLLAVLLVLGWLWSWLAFAVLAVGLAVAYRYAVIRPLRAERAEPVRMTQEMLKELRVRGVAEEALYDFVCRFSGVEWEEFFEEFFGYEAMILARGKWAKADKVKPRKKFATWREPLMRFLENVEEARKEARNRKALAKAEARRLKATGMGEKEAEKQAEEATTKIMAGGLLSKADRDAMRQEKIEGYYEGTRATGPLAPGKLFIYGRLLLALGILAGWAGVALPKYGVPVPGFIGGIFEKIGYYEMGAGESIFALVAALLLVASVFIGRALLPAILISVGSLLMVGMRMLIDLAGQPMLNATTALIGACGLLGAGALMLILGRKR